MQISVDKGPSQDFLVDTGSGFVVLTEKTFSAIRELPGTHRVRTINGAMANGKVMRVPLYEIAELELGEGCVLQNVEVAVIPGGTRNIFGLSALKRIEPFAMDLSSPSLLFSNCMPAIQVTAATSVDAL